jgi:predicted GNAT family acetyltransferase
MKIKHKDDSEYGMFYIEQNGERIAEMTYAWATKDRIIIDHTEVDSSLKGHGVGKQLVSKAVEFARKRHIKIVATCSFARRVFDQTDEYNDVL